VVAWRGNYVPFKYNLRHFMTINTVSYDHCVSFFWILGNFLFAKILRTNFIVRNFFTDKSATSCVLVLCSFFGFTGFKIFKNISGPKHIYCSDRSRHLPRCCSCRFCYFPASMGCCWRDFSSSLFSSLVFLFYFLFTKSASFVRN